MGTEPSEEDTVEVREESKCLKKGRVHWQVFHNKMDFPKDKMGETVRGRVAV